MNTKTPTHTWMTTVAAAVCLLLATVHMMMLTYNIEPLVRDHVAHDPNVFWWLRLLWSGLRPSVPAVVGGLCVMFVFLAEALSSSLIRRHSIQLLSISIFVLYMAVSLQATSCPVMPVDVSEELVNQGHERLTRESSQQTN